MKKLLMCALVTFAVAPLAFASKARLEALGQSANGSYFIDDSRNIFLNPATLAGMSNQLNIEVGNNTTTPKAEGGLIHNSDFGSLGLQLGRIGMGAQNISDAEGTIPISLFNPQNSVEFLYARDIGSMNVGGALLYANSDSDTGATANLPDHDASVMTLRGGVANDQFSAYLNYGLTEESNTENVGNVKIKYDGSTSAQLGGVYNLSKTTKVAGEIVMLDYKFDDGAGLTGDYSKQNLAVNFYNQLAGDDTYFIFYSVGLAKGEQTIDYDPAAANDVEDSQMYLPIVIGGEAKVKEWLTLRASVKQNTIIDSDETKNGATDLKTNNLDDTVIAAGLGLEFGRVTIDSVLEGARSGSGKIDGNELLAKVAFKYTY
ncbi:MAG: hypothetical protein KDD40_07935 [Bdellovibrionales bacterium]|nr:hypothetical protein [Bdellovibrionales bacterium]